MMPTKQPVPPPTEKRIPVRLIGDHPHTGKRGYLLSKDGQIETLNVLGTHMIKVYLLDDHTDACYAQFNRIAEEPPTSPPPPRKRK